MMPFAPLGMNPMLAMQQQQQQQAAAATLAMQAAASMASQQPSYTDSASDKSTGILELLDG